MVGGKIVEEDSEEENKEENAEENKEESSLKTNSVSVPSITCVAVPTHSTGSA